MPLQPIIHPTLHLPLPLRQLYPLRQRTRREVEMHKPTPTPLTLTLASLQPTPQLPPNPMAPIPTLHHILTIPQPAHQPIKNPRSILQRPTRPRRPVRKAEPGQTGDHDVESRIFGVGWVGEGTPDRGELPESAWPAVAHQEGDCVGPRGAGVDEVDVDSFEARFEVRDGVDRGLDRGPVVRVQPGFVEVLGAGVGRA